MKNSKRGTALLISVLLALSVMLCSCESNSIMEEIQEAKKAATETTEIQGGEAAEKEAEPEKAEEKEIKEEKESTSQGAAQEKAQATVGSFDLSSIPPYSGSPYVAVNKNTPFFTNADNTTEAFETYSPLDSLGRCGVAYANICKELMPTKERESISQVKPSGWHSVQYENVDGKSLYNRCHLIGFQLAGENANEKNLITGTRYLNVEGMLPFENMVADYVKETKNHVLYRVTPIFEGDNLVASGVLMEAKSVEDDGDGVFFNVYCYNVQPEISINYKTGDSAKEEVKKAVTNTENTSAAVNNTKGYVGNKNTKKFHNESCSSVNKMKPENKVSLNSRDEALSQGYEPCKQCNP